MGWSQIVQFREVYKELKLFLRDYTVKDDSMELPSPLGVVNVSNIHYQQDGTEENYLILSISR